MSNHAFRCHKHLVTFRCVCGWAEGENWDITAPAGCGMGQYRNDFHDSHDKPTLLLKSSWSMPHHRRRIISLLPGP